MGVRWFHLIPMVAIEGQLSGPCQLQQIISARNGRIVFSQIPFNAVLEYFLALVSVTILYRVEE